MMLPENPDISIHWASHKKPDETVDLVVVVPTFKRPEHLQVTLASVLEQKTNFRFSIVVMDNHPQGSEGAKAAQALLEGNDVPSTVILAHRRGNCAAYNAGFETALKVYPSAQWIQILDDDEIARPGWLEQQVAAAKKFKADFTGAPQHPVFNTKGHDHWKTHPVFMPPYNRDGSVPILYSSGNVLINTNLLRQYKNPWLDETFNFLGGGDSDFYSRCKSAGATFAWCNSAGVDETTPVRRTELSWLNSRSLRNGSISALIQQKAAQNPSAHLKRIIKTLLLLAASPYRSLTLFVKKRSLIMALNPMNVALGRLLMEFGFANEQYRAADKN